ncbi:hypothetical protein BGC07_14950 [Piscirickettsia litoralis]|uniref:4Fe-4S ferredoxin-type domain-containing protein n=1 Tax=Piscirickettsia litoralis TaxID=1891921 RepID=A0ABX3A508_9GAMM|nr:hypothetical protein BGC07_14950 [Piscirickettsia litoralis]
MCPLGALSQWAGKFGFKRAIPKWMKWNGWLIIMFIIVTILGQTLDVRDDPAGLAKLFLYIFALAIIIGFIYGKNKSRPWCRYFCPIGKILGVVSRLGMLDFRANKAIPKLPKDKSYYVEGRLCPTDYNLRYKTDTSNCISCGQCAYGKEKAGLGLYKRKAGTEVNNILNSQPNWSEIVFILFSPGLAAGGFLWLILNQYEQYRQMIGTWFINHNSFWIFNPAVSWLGSQTWNQHFSWLDVSFVTVYMLAYSLIIGLASILIISLATWVIQPHHSQREIYTFKNTFIALVYQNIPTATLSIVIGLCGKFFEVMHHDFGMSLDIAMWIKLLMLLASMLWTLQLTWQTVRRVNKNTLKRTISMGIVLINIGMMLYLWWPAILGHAPMSEVEQIRQHIITPG